MFLELSKGLGGGGADVIEKCGGGGASGTDMPQYDFMGLAATAATCTPLTS